MPNFIFQEIISNCFIINTNCGLYLYQPAFIRLLETKKQDCIKLSCYLFPQANNANYNFLAIIFNHFSELLSFLTSVEIHHSTTVKPKSIENNSLRLFSL